MHLEPWPVLQLALLPFPGTCPQGQAGPPCLFSHIAIQWDKYLCSAAEEETSFAEAKDVCYQSLNMNLLLLFCCIRNSLYAGRGGACL